MRRNLLLVLLVIVLIIYFLWYTSPEQKIKRNLKNLKKSVENEDLDRVLDKIASFFNYYQYDKEDAEQDCEMFFNNYDRIKVEIREIEVKVKKGEGISSFGLRVVARYGGYFYILVGGIGEFENVEFYWKKERKKWKIYSCRFPTLKYWIHARPKKLKKKKKYIKV